MPPSGMWWGTWSPYFRFDGVGVREVPSEPGIYLIAAFARDGSRPERIPRCLNEDRFGVLWIGKAVNLNRRISSLNRSLRTGVRGHSGGFRYGFVDDLQRQWKESRKLRTRFPPESLRFAYSLSSSASDAADDECGALRHYLLKYGELPPLNNQFSWKKWAVQGGAILRT